ncbi:cell wall hydrolase [Paenibacillus swuensis]|uniref:cell wall hydrolase n=1 Tax=Paenibacillus swuensis TaxID=1178515 RepID=UPI0018D4886E|nr:cell wall hydrolase [Paenibacillus swuensis]
MLMLLVVILATVPFQATAEMPKLNTVKSPELQLEEGAYMENNRLYVPIRYVVEHGEAKAQWDKTKGKLTLRTAAGDVYSQTLNKYSMAFNNKVYMTDTRLVMKEGRTYLPVRDAAELMHKSAEWSVEEGTVSFEDVPLYVVQAGDTLKSISQELNIPAKWLKERNSLNSDALYTGQELKIVIPRLMEHQKHMKEFLLLAKLIESEAGGEPMKGKVAVGNVVMNRVEDPRFPDSIRDVIYAHNQFEVVANGAIDRKVPSADSLSAAQQALGGVNYVPQAVFFYNPSAVRSPFLESLDFVTDIGGHRFLS